MAYYMMNGTMMQGWGNVTNFRDFFMGSAFGALFVAGLIILLILVIALYVYTSLSWYKIGKRMKYKHSWLAWVPIANISMYLQLGGFHWAWVFLVLIPLLGWAALLVLVTISVWRIFEKNKQSGWLSLSLPFMFVPIISWAAAVVYLVCIGMIAWKKK